MLLLSVPSKITWEHTAKMSKSNQSISTFGSGALTTLALNLSPVLANEANQQCEAND